MKIFAVNSSPRKEKSNTDRILRPFLNGAKEAGAEVELVYLHDKKLKPCLGCFHCWLKTPGVCCQKDDAAQILEKMRASDMTVYATPLYVFGMNAKMKLLLDRIMPLALPFIRLEDGHCTHPFRHGHRMKKMVVVSNCGFHELDNFDEMMIHFKAIARHGKTELAGALLRPHGEFLPYGEQLMPEKVNAIYEAARKAGKEAVEKGKIPQNLQDEVAQELIPLDVFLTGANNTFKKRMTDNGLSEEEFKGY